MPTLRCENEVTEAKNYLIMALTAFKATAEVIFDRLMNVTIVCQIIKPLIIQNLPWNHTSVFTLIRSASNIFLMKLLSEFYDLKSKLLESEEQIVEQTQGNSIEEKTWNIIEWFMHGTVKEKPMTTPSSKSKRKRGKMIPTTLSVESSQEDKSNLPSIGCRIRMCVDMMIKGRRALLLSLQKRISTINSGILKETE